MYASDENRHFSEKVSVTKIFWLHVFFCTGISIHNSSSFPETKSKNDARGVILGASKTVPHLAQKFILFKGFCLDCFSTGNFRGLTEFQESHHVSCLFHSLSEPFCGPLWTVHGTSSILRPRWNVILVPWPEFLLVWFLFWPFKSRVFWGSCFEFNKNQNEAPIPTEHLR